MLSSHLLPRFTSGQFPNGFYDKTLGFFILPNLAHRNLQDFSILAILRDLYKTGSPLYNILNYPFTSTQSVVGLHS